MNDYISQSFTSPQSRAPVGATSLSPLRPGRFPAPLPGHPRMQMTVPIVTLVTLLTLAPALWRLQSRFRQTALHPAWPWLGLAWLATLLVLPVDRWLPVKAGPAQVAWYAAAVLALAPGIAVLGARWPTARVWNLFVVLPLLAVFSWPIAVPALRGSRLEQWQLEEPMVCAYGLVLLMGAGNYLGTRKTFSALAYMAGWLLVVCSVCPAFRPAGAAPETIRAVAAGCLCVAALALPRAPRKPPLSVAEAGPPQALAERWQLLLAEFHELFGMVWTRRLQERFQDQARQASLPVAWTWEGLEAVPVPGPAQAPGQSADLVERAEPVSGRKAGLDAEQLAVADRILRWLLVKFVEPGWIEARVPASTRDSVARLPPAN